MTRRRPTVMTPAQAAALIADGTAVAISATAGVSMPDVTVAAIGERFRETGHPADLTAVFPVCPGDMFGQPGIDHLANPGQLRRVIGGSFPSGPASDAPPRLYTLIAEEALEAFNYPMGVLTSLLSESAAKGPGILTRTGIGSFIDPDQGGGGLNRRSRAASPLRHVEVEGERYIFFPRIPVDVAVIRATSADPDGNLTFEHEGALVCPFTLAAAARSNGGRVIAQVKRLVEAVDPRTVKVPGYMVDAIVVDPYQMQATNTDYDPAISGQARADRSLLPRIEPGLQRVVGRRAAMEIAAGDVAVIGFGMCANIPSLLLETGEVDDVSFVIEQGSVGGIPLTGFKFGCSHDAAAYLDTRLAFDYLRGGGFDIALLSFLEIDAAGNVNVSRLAERPYATAGVGGFLDIVQNAPRLVFAGRFRAGGGEIEVGDAGLTVVREARTAKLVGEVAQATVAGEVLHRPGREVRIVTERGVFALAERGLTLLEYAPGLDPRRDIVDQAELPVAISEAVREMDPRCFIPEARPLLASTPQGA